jgi:hypothetical protein
MINFNFPQKARTYQTRELKIPKTFQIPLLCLAPKVSQAAKTLKLKALSKTDCVSSGNRNITHTRRKLPAEANCGRFGYRRSSIPVNPG